MEDKTFISGFNKGYFLRDHAPELLDNLLRGIKTENNALIEGMKAGQNQRENELQRERIKISIEHGSNGKEKNSGNDRTR